MRALLVVAVVVVGCSPAPNPHRPGQPCTDEPDECLSDATKVICNAGVWLEYPCDSTFALADGGTLKGRCLLPGAPQQCLHPVPAAGDWCPAVFEGKYSRCISKEESAKCSGGEWRSCAAPRCRDFLLNGNPGDGVASTWDVVPDAGC